MPSNEPFNAEVAHQELRESMNAIARAQVMAFGILVNECAASGLVDPGIILRNLREAGPALRQHNEHPTALVHLRALAEAVETFCELPPERP